MRDIEFRGQRKSTGEWLKGDLVKVSSTQYQISNCIGYCNGFDISLATLGQYTELLDKNGVRIYEGDILEKEAHWSVFVEFKDGIYYAVSTDKVRYINKIGKQPLLDIYLCEWSVVGNIHDSPLDFELD